MSRRSGKAVEPPHNDNVEVCFRRVVHKAVQSRPAFTKVSKALNLSKEDRDQLSSFINSEELFNMIAHQRHLREDYRHFMIRQMRKDAEINKVVRTGFQEARFDLEKPSDQRRLYEINRAIFEKRDVRRVCRTGLDKLEKNLAAVNSGIKRSMTHEDGKPVSYSISQEEELKEELRKDGIARGLITEKETGVLQFETDKPKLRWKWGFSLADQIRTLTSKDLDKDIKRGQKNKKAQIYDTIKNENQLRAAGPLDLLGEDWLRRQRLGMSSLDFYEMKHKLK